MQKTAYSVGGFDTLAAGTTTLSPSGYPAYSIQIEIQDSMTDAGGVSVLKTVTVTVSWPGNAGRTLTYTAITKMERRR